ncbi:MAG: anaerobic glycerol-3-phosphate dehydrogenase subunit C [Thermodesulfobacteriota bacterium]
MENRRDQSMLRELQKQIEGEVLLDELSRALYGSAASLYRIKPLGVVKPRHRGDVIKVVEYAAKRRISITARGGGTSRAGNEVGEGILLDLSKYLTDILDFNPQEKWVRVQPGLILGSLNKFLKPHRLFFPIDPSTKDHCTLGGMIANNSSGPHAVKYGATRDYVLSLEVVLSNGETLTTGPVSQDKLTAQERNQPGTLEEKISRTVPDILKRYQKPLKEEKPFTMKNSSGYDLWRLQGKGSFDLTSLFIGSEGTIGIVTEAKLRLMPLPGKVSGGLIYFDHLDPIGTATQKILEHSPAMIEIIERRILDLARKQRPELKPYLPEGTEAILFVEFQNEKEEHLRNKFREIEERLVHREKLAYDLKVAMDDKDMAMLEKVRSISGPILNKIKGPKRPVAFIEDGAVHPSCLPQYIKGLRDLFKRFEVDAGIYGHAGDGNLHLMVFLDPTQEDDVKRMVSLADACYDLVLSLRGTISGEHGDGRLRTFYLKRQFPNLYPAMVEMKNLFDPENTFNPGCIVGGDQNPLGQNLKFVGTDRVTPGVPLFDKEPVRTAIETCSGCGKCRSYCPVGQEVREEWAIGRAKATLLREVLSGALNPKILDSPEFKDVMDSCLNCKRCLTECPSGVDIPWLALSSRAHYIEKHGEPLGQRFFTKTRPLCRAGSVLAPLINLANSLPPVRRCLETAVGLDRRRHLPPFQRKTLRKILKDRLPSQGKKQVAYFLSCYSNFNEPEGDGLATIEVLERNGFHVLVPDFKCCGIARINSGAILPVMEDMEANVKMMSALVERRISIVFSEPSCALAVKMEYPKILNSRDASKVAEKCYDIHQFLMMLHKKGELNLDFGKEDLTVGYHNPCHLRALGIVEDPVKLLGLIPGVKVQVFSDGCCGLVGAFGLKRKNFDLSMAIGGRLFKEIQDSPADYLFTPCGACRLQIFQGTQRKAAHPVSLLALAYESAQVSVDTKS